MIGEIIAGLATGGAGSIVGVISSFASSWMKNRQAKEQIKQKIELLRVEHELNQASHAQKHGPTKTRDK